MQQSSAFAPQAEEEEDVPVFLAYCATHLTAGKQQAAREIGTPCRRKSYARAHGMVRTTRRAKTCSSNTGAMDEMSLTGCTRAAIVTSIT